MGLDVAIKAENSPTSRSSSSSSSSSRNSLSLSSSSSSSSTQYSRNHSNSSDMAAGVEHSCIGAHRHIIRVGAIRECVIDLEGRGISTRNVGQMLHLPLTSQFFQVHTSRTTAIFLPLQYRTCNLDHLVRGSRPLHHLSRCRCLHRHRLHHHSFRLKLCPLRHHRIDRRCPP